MASVTIWVRPGTEVWVHNRPNAKDKFAPTITVDGALVMIGDTGDDASILVSANVLIDALAKIRDGAQERLAQGWRDEIEANPPLAKISESEARALHGDR